MNALRPVCFMVMPFGKKKTDAPAGSGPAEVNFDALWEKALSPVIESLGYEPVRADQDVGALIVHEMLERLYFSDLIIADMTIPNGNVYYEVGIRHACQRSGCILVAADWAKPLFDVAQMRRVSYPLAEGDITDTTAAAIIATLKTNIPAMVNGQSPMYVALPGFPQEVDETRASSIRKHLEALSAFQAKVAAVHAVPKAERSARAKALVDEYAKPTATAAVAHSLLKLVEDLGEWNTILNIVGKLPPNIKDSPDVVELINLATSKAGNHLEAIGALEALIQSAGPTSEREGLLGGRYKKLYKQATDPADKARYLNEAIEHYERGMMLDLNDYYPSSNLPRLYRRRGRKGDDDKARSVAQVVYCACQRAKGRGAADEWLRPTLLGAAFDAGDVQAAETLYEDIVTEGIAVWKLDTTIADLELSLDHVADADRQAALRSVYDRLKALL